MITDLERFRDTLTAMLKSAEAKKETRQEASYRAGYHDAMTYAIDTADMMIRVRADVDAKS